MKLEKEKLFSLLYTRKISREEFIERYFADIPLREEYLISLLERAILEKNPELLGEVVVLLSCNYFNTGAFLLKLCDLLSVDWHIKHEDIAMMLQEAKDPHTIQCLYNAAELSFDYLEYDETYQFGRKCIKALSAINNDEAILKLKLLTKSSISMIAYYANKELAKKNIE